jgi:Sulfotransferase family
LFFIVGSARSGTTLLRIILNSHSDVAVPPESRFVVDLYRDSGPVDIQSFLTELEAHQRFQAWSLPIDRVKTCFGATKEPSYGEAIEILYRCYATAKGKSRYGDKTPRYIEHIPLLAELFPTAKFIHMVRDGRNVALSYAEVPFGPKTVARAAALWSGRVQDGLDRGRPLGPARYLEMRYEDFVAQPHEKLRSICSFLQLDFQEAMLDYAHESNEDVLSRAARFNPHVTQKPIAEVRSWREQMGPGQVEVFEAVAGETLSTLGYPRMYPKPRVAARISGLVGRWGAPIGRLPKDRAEVTR